MFQRQAVTLQRQVTLSYDFEMTEVKAVLAYYDEISQHLLKTEE